MVSPTSATTSVLFLNGLVSVVHIVLLVLFLGTTASVYAAINDKVGNIKALAVSSGLYAFCALWTILIL
jgi:hypothetical protein